MRLKPCWMPVVLTIAALAAVPAQAGDGAGYRSDSARFRRNQQWERRVDSLFSGDSAPVIRAQSGSPTLVGPNGILPGTANFAGGESVNAVPHDPSAVHAVPADTGWNPWPGIQMYGERFRRLENEKGVWQYEARNDPRRYYSSIGAMFFHLRRPDRSLFGDDGAFIAEQANNAGGGRPIVRLGSAQFNGDSSLSHPFKTEGIRLAWGFRDADDTGLDVTAWWASDIRESFKINPSFNAGAPPTTQTTGPIIPANDGQGGSVIFVDGRFDLAFQQTAANVQFNRIMAPFWHWHRAISIHTAWGARYTFVKERMTMDGVDFISGTPDLTSQINLNSAVTSHLAGPSIGLHYTVGGDLLKFVFNTNVIFYVNHQRERLDGFGFDDDLTPTTGIGPNFHDRQNRTHFSPAFEQTVRAEAPVFSWIPYIRDMAFFRNAKLKGGVTFLTIGEFSRPNSIVDFRMAPLVPRLDERRDTWGFIAYDASLVFEY